MMMTEEEKRLGFNPSVGILGGQTHAGSAQSASDAGFNPSVGILGGQTKSTDSTARIFVVFQSLSRDSWWSNSNMLGWRWYACSASIPQSGFLVVKLGKTRARCHISCLVSIPQSGFLVVKPIRRQREALFHQPFQSLSRDSWWSNQEHQCRYEQSQESFNPSVGILGGQTRPFLIGDGMTVVVSIPQSGFLVVKLSRAWS